MKKRTETVKNRIALAFIRLLKEKEYHDITIVDIINEAQAGRMSFYRNFADKDDILRHYIAAVTDEWLSHTEENYITLTNVKQPLSNPTQLAESNSIYLLKSLVQF